MGKKNQPTNQPQASSSEANTHMTGGQKRATPEQRMAYDKAKINPENLFNTADIKQLFNISESSVKRWRKQRVLPYTKVGGTIYYMKDVIFQILHDRTRF